MAEGSSAAVEDKPSRRVGDYSLDGLSVAWENRANIRDRLRAKNSLLVHYDTKLGVELVPSKGDIPKSIPNLRANDMVMSPVLRLMRQNGLLQPNLDRLITEVGAIYRRNSIPVKDAGDVFYHNAWSIRQLASLQKAELARVNADVQKGTYTGKDGLCSCQNML